MGGSGVLANEYLSRLCATGSPSRHTVLAYASDLRHFEGFLGTTLDTAKSEAIVSYLGSLKQRGAAARTIRRRMACLRGFFKHLTVEGTIERSPFDGIALRLPRARSLPRSLSRHDAQLLASAAWSQDKNTEEPLKQHFAIAVLVLISTGLRVGELVDLSANDYRNSDGGLRVKGKGHRERLVFVADPVLKTRLYEISEQRFDFSLFGVGPTRWSTDWVRKRLRIFSANAGVRQIVTPHMLRHTCATLLLDNGVDIRFLQKLLGHESISTTAIYAHVGDAGLQKALESARLLSRLSHAA